MPDRVEGKTIPKKDRPGAAEKLTQAIERFLRLDESNKTVLLVSLSVFIQAGIAAYDYFLIVLAPSDLTFDIDYFRVVLATQLVVLAVYIACLVAVSWQKRRGRTNQGPLYVFVAAGTLGAMFSINALGTFSTPGLIIFPAGFAAIMLIFDDLRQAMYVVAFCIFCFVVLCALEFFRVIPYAPLKVGEGAMDMPSDPWSYLFYFFYVLVFMLIVVFLFHVFITFIKSRETVLEERNRALSHLDRLKDEVLAICSHDIKSPISIILGFSNVLIDQPAVAGDAKSTGYVRHIQRAAEEILGLVDDLLDTARLEQGRYRLLLSSYFLNSIVRSCYETFVPLFQEKNIDFTFRPAGEVEPIICDRLKIERAIQNLIGNAFKFTPEGGKVSLGVRVTDGGKQQIFLSDTGSGMSEEEKRVVLRSLKPSAIRTSPPDGRGAGLGLSIVKTIVELHSGGLDIESRLGVGTTVTITLPEKPLDVSSREKDEGPARRVLIVDNDKNVLDSLEAALEKNGFLAVRAENAASAILMIRETMPDLVIADFELPDLDGYGLIKKIRNLGRAGSMPVIAMTAHEEDPQKFSEADFNDFIGKPFTTGDILESIDRCLVRRFSGDDLSGG